MQHLLVATPRSIVLRAPSRGLASAAALPFSEIPSPPKDSKPYDARADPTHVEFFMGAGGPTKMADVHASMYTIGDLVKYRFPGSEYMLYCADPDEMLKLHKACGPTPLGSTVSLWPFMEYFHKHQKKYKAIPMAFTTDPAYWKVQRHALQKGLFGFEDAKSYVPLFNSAVREAVMRFPKEQSDMMNYLNKLTFEVIHLVLFGTRANAIDPDKAPQRDIDFINATLSSFSAGPKLQYDPMGQLIPKMDQLPKEYLAAIPKETLDTWGQFVKDINAIIEIGADKVKETLARAGESSQPGVPDCLVVRYAKDGILSQDELFINGAGLLQGGVDTTSNSILWSLTRLAQFPEAQEKCRQEIQALGKPKETLWDAERLSSLKLLPSFFDETMRFAATASGHRRTTAEDCEIVSRRSGQRYIVPKGTDIFFSNREMRVDPKYVTNSETFQVDRYTRECKHARRGKPEALIDSQVADVFSFGPRMCLGARLAKVEMLNILAETLENFKVEFQDPNQKVGITNTFLTRPDPVPKFKFTRV